ncbi:hypothetical protein MZO42_05765 [Sphingomonas psychrotolerans]|uniref:Uncharacterized protein n=1 Tax=Sphingomonas psychrotolerans TaxID=1327635 RepID=A0ABU3N131_9SPHN|nr:hypothetical protein [Sphingomonas psychrotolerans]MDT8758197.1 hypothetical protein [Sphingomonas psychrotolerans]
MNWIGAFGGLLALVGAAAIGRSLWAGEVPGRWPAPPIGRRDHPGMFWFNVGGYAATTALGLALAFL